MRWIDLPPDGGQADGRDSADHRRAQWAELRQRLERLPPGHPSSPDQDERDRGQDERDTGREAGDLADPAAAREPESRVGSDPEAARGMPADGDRGRVRGQGGRHDQSLTGRRDPYRPWFTDGEPFQPWFADESG
jgi:hypothetical protein